MQPVAVLKYPLDGAPMSRHSRFWAAFGVGLAPAPHVMVDSGHEFSCGAVDYNADYQRMIETSRIRAAQGQLRATWERLDDSLLVNVLLTNLSPLTLSPSNAAAVHALAYEDGGMGLHGRIVGSPASVPINGLAPGAAGRWELQIPNVQADDWTGLRILALADYLPGVGSRAYDILQAAWAAPAVFRVDPQRLTFHVRSNDPVVATYRLSIEGPRQLSWSLTSSQPWIVASPTRGGVGTQVEVSVVVALMTPGWQEGTVTLSADDRGDSIVVDITAHYTLVFSLYLPLLRR